MVRLSCKMVHSLGPDRQAISRLVVPVFKKFHIHRAALASSSSKTSISKSLSSY